VPGDSFTTAVDGERKPVVEKGGGGGKSPPTLPPSLPPSLSPRNAVPPSLHFYRPPSLPFLALVLPSHGLDAATAGQGRGYSRPRAPAHETTHWHLSPAPQGLPHEPVTALPPSLPRVIHFFALGLTVPLLPPLPPFLLRSLPPPSLRTWRVGVVIERMKDLPETMSLLYLFAPIYSNNSQVTPPSLPPLPSFPDGRDGHQRYFMETAHYHSSSPSLPSLPSFSPPFRPPSLVRWT